MGSLVVAVLEVVVTALVALSVKGESWMSRVAQFVTTFAENVAAQAVAGHDGDARTEGPSRSGGTRAFSESEALKRWDEVRGSCMWGRIVADS